MDIHLHLFKMLIHTNIFSVHTKFTNPNFIEPSKTSQNNWHNLKFFSFLAVKGNDIAAAYGLMSECDDLNVSFLWTVHLLCLTLTSEAARVSDKNNSYVFWWAAQDTDWQSQYCNNDIIKEKYIKLSV